MLLVSQLAEVGARLHRVLAVEEPAKFYDFAGIGYECAVCS